MTTIETTCSYARARGRTLELGTQISVLYILELAEGTVE
jgi:hypothetical protein